MSAIGKTGQFILWSAIVWLLVAGLLALQFWPHVPQSVSGWVAFVAFGPPMYVLAEGAAEWVWSSRTGRAISNHQSSALRILLGVLIVMFVCGVIWGGLWLLPKP